MTRSVRAFVPVLGEAAALVPVFEGDPEAWLDDPRRDGAANRWVVVVHAGALRRTVRLTIGDTWTSGATHWRSLSWEPVAADGDPTAVDRLLPALDGELGLSTEHAELPTVILDARYDPPGGRLGTAVDAVALHRLAQTTVTSFAASVATNLGASVAQPDTPRSPETG